MEQVSSGMSKSPHVSSTGYAMLLDHGDEKVQLDSSVAGDRDTTGSCCCSALSHPQLTELSLTVSLTVWLAVLASTCLVVVYWL
jgi:hypothetical protein